MSITPHRDAAAATVEGARARYARTPPADPITMLARRMDVEATEVVIVGYGELRDLGANQGVCGIIIVRVVASALASFIATVCGGRQDACRKLLDALLIELKDRCLERIAKIPTDGISASVTPSEPRGRA